MDRAALITRIRRGLKYNTGLNVEIITDAINDAQDLLEQSPEFPWFIESDYTNLTTVVDDEKISVPSDFIRMADDKNVVWRYDTSNDPVWVPISFGYDLDDVRAYFNSDYAAATGDTPKAVVLQGNYFRVFPTPTEAKTLRILYYKQVDKMTTNTEENVWAANAPYLLIGKAGSLIASYQKNKDLKKDFDDIFAEAQARLTVLEEARKQSNMQLERGGAD